MRRREVFGVLGGFCAAPWFAYAQQRVPRIGGLLLAGPELMGPYQEALRELGYVEGRNIQFEIKSAQGQVSRLAELAAALVRSNVDIILASLTPAVAAARRATSDIPIVMAPGGDPVASGFVSSLARPGGNITGVSGTATELSAKTLEVVREFIPSARRIAVISNPNDPLARVMLEQIQQGSERTHFSIHPVVVHKDDELEAAFSAATAKSLDAIILSATLPIQRQIDLALKHRLPTFNAQSSTTRMGVLVSYSASIAERGSQIASYVDRILRGARPVDLPVQQPSKFELVINLKVAKKLGLVVPSTLLARADEVIE